MAKFATIEVIYSSLDALNTLISLLQIILDQDIEEENYVSKQSNHNSENASSNELMAPKLNPKTDLYR